MAELDPTKTNQYWYAIDGWLTTRDGGSEVALIRNTILNSHRFAPSYVAGAYHRLAGFCRQTALYECGAQLERVSKIKNSYVRACLLAGLGTFDVAIEACSEALAENPGAAATRADRCIWLARTGQYTRASSDIEVLNGLWGTHHFPAFNFHFWRGDLDAARSCAEWLSHRERDGAVYKGVSALMLEDPTSALEYFEVGAQQARLYGGILRWAADAYLPDSLRAKLDAEPRWHAALAHIEADDASRRLLIDQINELTPRTGITLDARGVPLPGTA